jgi:flagellar hook protein FlgE
LTRFKQKLKQLNGGNTMSLTSAMFTGVSGLLNMAEGINVIGNNISNVNTVGFKGSRTLFSDVLSTSVSSGSQMGHGVQLQKIDNMFTQSTFENTGSVSDLAIQGDRFFALGAPASTGAVAVAPGDAYYTRAGSFRMDGQANATAAFPIAGKLINPDGYAVLDGRGMPVEIPLTDGAAVPKSFQKITGIDAKGVMTLLYADATGASSTYYYAGNGVAPLPTSVAANYTTVTTGATSGQLGTVQIGNPPGMEKAGGTLFRATAKSGMPDVPGAVAWASNGVTETISSNNLEQSNVDMATEFVKMILTQRAYSANSKTITTADEMTQEVLNLKR